MPHLVTGIITLNMSGNVINRSQVAPSRADAKRCRDSSGKPFCQLSETIKFKDRELIIYTTS